MPRRRRPARMLRRAGLRQSAGLIGLTFPRLVWTISPGGATAFSPPVAPERSPRHVSSTATGGNGEGDGTMRQATIPR